MLGGQNTAYDRRWMAGMGGPLAIALASTFQVLLVHLLTLCHDAHRDRSTNSILDIG